MKVYILMHTAEIGQDKSTECVGVFTTKEKAQKNISLIPKQMVQTR